MACHQHRLLGVSAFHWGQRMSRRKSTWLPRYYTILEAGLSSLHTTCSIKPLFLAGVFLYTHYRGWVQATWILQARLPTCTVCTACMPCIHNQNGVCMQKLSASTIPCSHRPKQQQLAISPSALYHQSAPLVCILLQDTASHRAASQAGQHTQHVRQAAAGADSPSKSVSDRSLPPMS